VNETTSPKRKNPRKWAIELTVWNRFLTYLANFRQGQCRVRSSADWAKTRRSRNWAWKPRGANQLMTFWPKICKVPLGLRSLFEGAEGLLVCFFLASTFGKSPKNSVVFRIYTYREKKWMTNLGILFYLILIMNFVFSFALICIFVLFLQARNVTFIYKLSKTKGF